MGDKLPQISGRELIRVLGKIGIVPVAQRGSHVKLRGYYKEQLRYTTIPVHSNDDLPCGVIKAVLGDLGISRDEFFKLLE